MSFFFLMFPRRPRSTLFPYTTLFRSTPADQLTAALAWLGIACYTLQIYFDFSGYSDMAIGHGRMFGLDRKSTRLNSSHRCISYAVFCLKKKNKQKTIKTGAYKDCLH